MKAEFKLIQFDDILPVWSQFLWPNRKSEIEKTSCIDPSGNIDIKIKQYDATFFAFHNCGQIMGVISCHPVSDSIMRLRGIYVFEEFRSQGVGHALVREILSFSLSLRYEKIFALVREKNRFFFEKLDFQCLKRTTDYEFGPHFIMTKEIFNCAVTPAESTALTVPSSVCAAL